MSTRRALATSRPSRPRGLQRCPILTLDGGGTKGFQTLGVLAEIEAMVGGPLDRTFRLMYGTSTGACTAAFLALGARVKDIVAFYREHIPPVLQERSPAAKSAAMRQFCRRAFGSKGFSAFRTGVGIVCTDWRKGGPLVLKTGTLPPGLDCTIARAVQASCSAFPVFDSARVRLAGLGTRELVDGSYCANNPTLFAIADALGALRQRPSHLRVISIGVGSYRAPVYRGWRRVLQMLKGVTALQKSFGINTESMDQLRRDLFPEVPATRINDHFGGQGLAVDFIESDVQKFDQLFECGRKSFARHKKALRLMLA